MPRKLLPSIIRILAEGTSTERRVEEEIISKQARKLANEMPTAEADRQVYVRNLLIQALAKKLNHEVFCEFVRITNSYVEVEQAFPRAKLVGLAMRKGGTKDGFFDLRRAGEDPEGSRGAP